jgi:hypothetical protein
MSDTAENANFDPEVGHAEQGFVEQPEPERVPASEMLAAAHEKYLGPEVAMHAGKPETGVGSKFHALHPAKKAHLAAIEHLILMEAEHAAAEAHLASIHAKVEHAMARVEATEEEVAKVEEPV